MKTKIIINTIASSLGLILAITLPSVVVLGVAGCAGDRYNRSTGEYIDDNGLKMRVGSALGDNPDYKFENVNVAVFKGTVQLSGFVNLYNQKSKAGELAKNVQGVRKVENNITVQDKDERTAGQTIDDKTLTGRVKDALSDNPEYKFDGVRVTSQNATVKLSGFVNTADQKSKAGQIAKNSPGTKEVVNNITVKDKMD